MQGGRRDKKTTLWHSSRLDLSSLAILCDKSHSHAPWGRNELGVFATAAERNYPTLLCERWAAAIKESLALHLTTPSRSLAPLIVLRSAVVKVALDERIFRNIQPRKRGSDLFPEFKDILIIKLSQSEYELAKNLKDKHAKIVRVGPYVLEERDKLLNIVPEDGDSIGLSKESSIAEVGQQWTPEEFVEQTKALVHPFDQTVQFPPATASVLLSMAH